MKKSKTLLLLGGSAQQVAAIEKAHASGVRTVLIDFLPDNPGRLVADKWYCESSTDIDAVEHIAKIEKADGILAYGSDPAAYPAAVVCERLGLATNPADSVKILSYKHLFRQFQQENGFRVPKWYAFSITDAPEAVSRKTADFKRPIIIKPTDSSGSKGVNVINTDSDLQQAIAFAYEFSRNGILIAEEYIQPGEHGFLEGDVYIINKQIVVSGDLEGIRCEQAPLVPTGLKWPAQLSPSQRDQIYSELEKIVDLLNLTDGEFNLGVIIDTEGNCFFNELGARAGGNMVPRLLSDVFGTDLIEYNIQTSLNQPIHHSLKKPESDFRALYVLHSHTDGVLSAIEIADEIKPYIYREIIYKAPGERVSKFTNARRALGILFMKFPDRQTMDNIMTDFHRHYKIHL
ncbi:MAG: hypothetical protein NC402_07040 [Prevotella sp.]|nr:hypothetical protein [Prevotella sp.]MCM1075166.1 hypothetical protein [Ruminococcus sp.]